MSSEPVLVPVSDRAARLARVHIGATVPLLVLASAVFFARFYLRVWLPRKMGVTEALILAGYVGATYLNYK